MRRADMEGYESDVVDLVARSLIKLQSLNGGVGGSGGNDGSGANDSVLRDDGDDDNRDKVTDASSLRGAIARIQGLGPLAAAVIDRMMTLRLEEVRMEMQQEEDAATDEDDVEEEYDDGDDVDGDDDNNDER
mmetsp:Transcript_11223/g.23310  ORF Transcript_11223/g.23310 Transcript_11223/m.23310 type:complete len:132 (-) Transcript_11223:200-595(-)